MPNPSFFIPLLLQSAVLPFGVALALLFTLRKHAAASVLALCAGFIAAYFAILHGQWSALPQQALDWLPAIAVLGTLGAITIEHKQSAAVRVIARFVLSLLATSATAWFGLQGLGAQKVALAAGLTAAAVCLIWSWLVRAAQSRPTPPLLMMVVAGGAGLALLLDSSQAIGQLCGVLASVIVACLAFNLTHRRAMFSAAAIGMAVLLLGVLLMNAYLYAGFSLAYVALLVAGLLADPLVHAVNRWRRHCGGAGSWATATALAAIPALCTIGLVLQAAQEAGGY
ncbi:MAG TPA: hypothetical protein VJ698_19610 [Noviherbaspirillum sp.]|uniref:hypothetical protein n=1 Tax=Noviherbaspirillum sp. TaxID=1926288 RepID=UPI002B475DC0|nr:hypothetical protein [Noviherbaspirillum sp.]HJV87686.1 hypothetical protein [Noviherbaspirillum sp.]